MSCDSGVLESTVLAEKKLHDFVDMAGTLISSPILSIQAQKLSSDLPVDNSSDFNASKGWLHRFQHHSNEPKTTKSDQFLQKVNVQD